MKTAVSIPDPLFKRAEAEAKKRGISRSKLHQLALEAYLEREVDAEITRRLSESYTRHPEPEDPFLQSLALETMRRMEREDEEGRDLVDGRRRAKRVRARVSPAGRHRIGK